MAPAAAQQSVVGPSPRAGSKRSAGSKLSAGPKPRADIVLAYRLPGGALQRQDVLGWKSCEFMARASGRIPLGTTIECCAGTEDNPQLQRVTGQVHWCALIDGDWQVGVFLNQPFAPELEAIRPADVRAHLRYEVRMPAYVRFGDSGRMKPVTIHNYSREGCAFAGRLKLEIGEQLQLLFNDNVADETVVDAKIVWSRPLADGEMLYGGNANWLTLG